MTIGIQKKTDKYHTFLSFIQILLKSAKSNGLKRKINTQFYILFMFCLASLFGVYNFIIYTDSDKSYNHQLSPRAMQGQTLWQENNCFTCHQLYGLGGYLGPDLTNIYSAKGKGSVYIKSILNSGINSMPKFNFSENEKEALVTYLKEVDSTGYYPNTKAKIEPSGWVKIQYKNEK